MKTAVQVRGFEARPWKSKTSGEQRYSGTYVLLDLDSDRPVMDTLRMSKDFDSEEHMKRGATLVGKQAVAIVTGLRVAFDGEAHLVGELEAASK